MLDVEAAGGDVGGDEDVEGAVAEAGHDPVALLLREAPVERRGVAAAAAERDGEVVHLPAGPREDQRRDAVLDVEDPAQRGELVRAPDDVGDLADPRRRRPRRPSAWTRTRDRVAEVAPREASDRARDRRREQRGLVARAASRGSSRGRPRSPCRASRRPRRARRSRPRRAGSTRARGGRRHARGRDDDVHAAREAVELRRDRLAAVHRHDARPDLATVLVGRLGHLDRQLAGRRQDERLRAAPAIAVARCPAALDGAARRRDPRRDAPRAAGAAAGRRPPSCRSPSAPRRGGRCPRAAAGSPRSGSASAPRSRARRGSAGGARRARGWRTPNPGWRTRPPASPVVASPRVAGASGGSIASTPRPSGASSPGSGACSGCSSGVTGRS